ncbi:nuclear transport factor 2 family protein [Mycobacterium spongiae]|uniref:DUF4440 domain-containing protein n=1 Tax=Mycobacterium spongiae TaxID=886343 RepID=A0A975PXL3_9MYCO|nr:nuclear transport factor 2 family protein [Mycobacterium spongiae]QUR68305.1 DUF4440 domain-containing protein [Mycobacterium spongiae]
MSDAANIDLVRRTYAAFSRGDLSELARCFAPDVEHIAPGKHALAGVLRGRDQVLARLSATKAACDDTLTVTLEEAFTNADGQVIAVDRSAASRNGKVLDERVAILFTIADGRVTRFSEFFANPSVLEDFWA